MSMDGNPSIYKARLVARGFTQIYGVDFVEMFSPVASVRSIRIVLAIAAYQRAVSGECLECEYRFNRFSSPFRRLCRHVDGDGKYATKYDQFMFHNFNSSLACWIAASVTSLPLSICAISLMRPWASSSSMWLCVPVGVSSFDTR